MVSDVLVGSHVAGYRIERELGRGSAGRVYLAYDARLGRKVALKLLPPSLAEDDAFRERFVRESLLTAAIEHPNVIPVYDAGEAEGRFYMAMRYIPGGSLRVRLREGRLEPEEAVAVVRQVAAALEAAHEHLLVHRDVKPENIMVDSTGTAYLVDFFVGTLSAEEAAAKVVFGTPPYIAPEVTRGEEVDARADLYSLACVLFECLTGDPPFGDEGMATLEAHVHTPVPKLSDRRPDLPRALDSVFERALAKNREERYVSATALMDAVAEALGRRATPIESGIVTFLFTDIEGSTRLLRHLRDRYPELVAEQQRVLRDAFTRHGGTEVDTQGESTFVVFRTATEAVLAAIAAQSALAARSWPEGAEVRVRIGIHTGKASLAGERYFGLAVHRASRICGFGRGGQTVVSETTRALLEDEEEELPGITLRDLGPHTLKDFERPVRLYELVSQ
jgi:serine/threonine-protein kinase